MPHPPQVSQAERTVNEALRDEITQLEASWSAQQAESVHRVTEQLEALQAVRSGELSTPGAAALVSTCAPRRGPSTRHAACVARALQQSEGQLDLREQYLERTRELVLLQLR